MPQILPAERSFVKRGVFKSSDRAINYPHTSNLVRFVCGFGLRKAQALMNILRKHNQIGHGLSLGSQNLDQHLRFHPNRHQFIGRKYRVARRCAEWFPCPSGCLRLSSQNGCRRPRIRGRGSKSGAVEETLETPERLNIRQRTFKYYSLDMPFGVLIERNCRI
jgi:hypothetical protein